MAYLTRTLSSVTISYQLTDAGSFRVVGNSLNNIITVRAGTGGGDILEGGAGNDRLTGSETNDVLIGGAGADVLDGGAGIDTADYSGSNAAVRIMLPLSAGMSTMGSGGHATGDTLRNIENVAGSNYNDTLGGGSGNNQLVGNLGNDIISGGSGDDVLFGDRIVDLDGDYIADNFEGAETPQDGADRLDGGFGNDVLVGGGGNDTLLGGFGNDRLYGGSGDDYLDGGDGDTSLGATHRGNWLYGGSGNDTLRTTFGDDFLGGGDGNDNLNSGFGDDELYGDGGNDILYADLGDDFLDGGAGNDQLDGGAGADQMFGGAGDDLIKGGLGGVTATGAPNDADYIDGGGGVDTVDYSTSQTPIGIDLGAGVFGDGSAAQTGAAFGDVLVNIENAIGTGGNDIIVGSNANNVLTGGAGADVLDGRSGVDTADYSTSAAAVAVTLDSSNPAGGFGVGGDAEGDRLFGIERIVGSQFADTLTGDQFSNILAGGAGADIINGGAGVDTADYSTSNAAVTVNLSDALAETGGHAQGDVLTGIERIIGSSFADILIGDGGTNYLAGGAGADTLHGAGGFDFADYSESQGAVNVSLNNGFTESGADAAGDNLISIEGVIGSAFADTLAGDNGGNQLEGRGGNDTLIGNGGNDFLVGGDGDDLLNGGAGADIIQGGAGTDTVDYRSSAGGVFVWLTANPALSTTGQGGDAAGDSFNNVENIFGSNDFSDVLVGSSAANFISSGAGNDQLYGGNGGDVLFSNGAGTKQLYGDTQYAGTPSDGGLPGQDTFLLQAGTSYIMDREAGEDIYVNGGGLVAAGNFALPNGQIVFGALLQGSAYTGWVVLGETTMTAAEKSAAVTELSQNVFQLNTFVG